MNNDARIYLEFDKHLQQALLDKGITLDDIIREPKIDQ